MLNLSKEQILTALARVIDFETDKDIVTANMISGVAIKAGKVGFLITISPGDKDKKSYLQGAAQAAVAAIPGVESVTAVLTSNSSSPLPAGGRVREGGAPGHGSRVTSQKPENVKKIIAVASGKGGVGKSTASVNLALALVQAGKNVGLLDADIYGPSIPRMLSLAGQPALEDGKMLPLERYGIKTNSMGYIAEDRAAILRGPMISKTLYQMLHLTRWASKEKPLDILLVDMPPGTGDIHLSMVQQVPLDGVIIVTTPQEIAVADARKCGQMFEKTGVKILGIIENMSEYLDGGGNKIAIFGEGGGKKLAEEFSAPLLAQIPLDVALREASDTGMKYAGQAADIYSQAAKILC